MGTVINVKVVTNQPESEVMLAITSAIQRFQEVEAACSRFDESSELRQLSQSFGTPVVVSDFLFRPLQFALSVADMTDGILDPTVGRVLHKQGFQKHYLTGQSVHDDPADPGIVSYRDVLIDEGGRTVTLKQPLTLDLGAVAKGFAVDLAAQELQDFEGFMIDAGGDIFVGGSNEFGGAWRVGIRHPVSTSEILCALSATNVAICTSGGYERKNPANREAHHLIDPMTGQSSNEILSSTVIAPFAMMADALSTVSFILGKERGVDFLNEIDCSGLLVQSTLDFTLAGQMEAYLNGKTCEA